ncbi:MAG: peptidylprolyl isomerase [Vampirovibrionales bacterium]|nr:peptidylprolyl isomerase [Vampirovibrionales bacterium]
MRQSNHKRFCHKLFPALLIVLITVATPLQAMAMGWDVLNPVSWFESDAAKARKRANEAELKAKDAEYRAQYAQKQADKLKQEAKTAKAEAASLKKSRSVTHKPAATKTVELSAKEQKRLAKRNTLNQIKKSKPLDYISEAHEGAVENGSQETDTLLGQPEDVVTEDYEPNISEQAETPTRQSVSETTPALKNQVQKTIPVRRKKRSPWNPVNWFRSGDDSTSAMAAEKPRVMMMQATTASQVESEAQDRISQDEVSSDKLAYRRERKDKDAEESLSPLPEGVEEADRQYYQAARKYRAAVLETERGNIVIELLPDAAPITVTNFVKLTENGFYNQLGMKFHRVIPGFVAQTGDPTGTGAGGSKNRIPLEVKNRLSHDSKGVVAMARGATPDSATSQFYITLAPQKSLDAKYAIFGKVIQGFDVLDKIEKDDRFYGVKMVDGTTITREEPDTDKQSFLKKIF